MRSPREATIPAAYAWLSRMLVKESKWLVHEADAVPHRPILNFCNNKAGTTTWPTMLPPGSRKTQLRTRATNIFGRLVKSDQIEKANAIVRAWVKEAQLPGDFHARSRPVWKSAVARMLGNTYPDLFESCRGCWLTPLRKRLCFSRDHETQSSITDRILRNTFSRRSEGAPLLRRSLADNLIDEARQDAPRTSPSLSFGWVKLDDAEPAAWKKIAEACACAGRTNPMTSGNTYWVKPLMSVLRVPQRGQRNSRVSTAAMAKRPGKAPHRIRQQLFNRLLEHAWSAEIEGEPSRCSTSSRMPRGKRTAFRFGRRVHRLDDRLLTSRIVAGDKAIKEPEELDTHRASQKTRRNPAPPCGRRVSPIVYIKRLPSIRGVGTMADRGETLFRIAA